MDLTAPCRTSTDTPSIISKDMSIEQQHRGTTMPAEFAGALVAEHKSMASERHCGFDEIGKPPEEVCHIIGYRPRQESFNRFIHG